MQLERKSGVQFQLIPFSPPKKKQKCQVQPKRLQAVDSKSTADTQGWTAGCGQTMPRGKCIMVSLLGGNIPSTRGPCVSGSARTCKQSSEQ